LTLEKRYQTDQDAIDDIFGRYPYLVHKDSYVAR